MAFDNTKHRLAKRVGYFCQILLAVDLEKLKRSTQFIIYHMKPGLCDTILREISQEDRSQFPGELKRGQVLEF